MSDRHQTLTPAPVSRDAPATIGDTFEAVEQHAADCERERLDRWDREKKESADRQGVVWARIIALENIVGKMEILVKRLEDSAIMAVKSAQESFRLKIAMVGIAVTLLGVGTTVGIWVAKYAIVGAITIELDKRLPPIGTKASLPAPVVHYTALPTEVPPQP